MPQDTWQNHQEWIRRQCASDWQQFEEQFEGDTPLHEALDLFYRVAQLPVDDPDLNGFWEQLLTAVEGYRQASDCDRRISCLRDLAVAAETCLKRIVKLAAPETYATLGRPANCCYTLLSTRFPFAPLQSSQATPGYDKTEDISDACQLVKTAIA
jgi:hypothetical protein